MQNITPEYPTIKKTTSLSWKLVIKTTIRVGIILALLTLLKYDIEPAKYLLFFYLFILFFEPKLPAIFCLLLILILPFLIYLKKNDLAEYYAIGAYVFLAGGVISQIVRAKKSLRKILLPILNPIICYIFSVLLFLLIILSPLIKPNFIARCISLQSPEPCPWSFSLKAK